MGALHLTTSLARPCSPLLCSALLCSALFCVLHELLACLLYLTSALLRLCVSSCPCPSLRVRLSVSPSLRLTQNTFAHPNRANAMPPVDMVNYAIERYFIERPNEKREVPLSSAMLSGISTRELLKLYFPEKDADLCLSYFGLAGSFPDTVSAASFVKSWPVNSVSAAA